MRNILKNNKESEQFYTGSGSRSALLHWAGMTNCDTASGGRNDGNSEIFQPIPLSIDGFVKVKKQLLCHTGLDPVSSFSIT